jgi:hypothetical protein
VATPGSRGLHALERCASRRSRRSEASAGAAIAWHGDMVFDDRAILAATGAVSESPAEARRACAPRPLGRCRFVLAGRLSRAGLSVGLEQPDAFVHAGRLGRVTAPAPRRPQLPQWPARPRAVQTSQIRIQRSSLAFTVLRLTATARIVELREAIQQPATQEPKFKVNFSGFVLTLTHDGERIARV